MLNSRSLNSYWKFVADKENKGEKNRWQDNIPMNAEDIWVPGCWNEHSDELYHYEGVAWYYKKIYIKGSEDIKRQVLFFYGVNYECEIFINGSFAGAHTGGYTPFEIDITKYVKYDAENLITVRVDAETGLLTVPPLNVDWFNYGGIFRDVELHETGTSWLDDVTVVTKADGNIRIKMKIGNYNGEINCFAAIRVVDPNSQAEVIKITKDLNSEEVEVLFKIPQVKLWSQESPFMYSFEITLSCNENSLDIWKHKIGVREFSIKDRKVLLNGKEVNLRGYSKHEEYPMLGRSFSYDIVRKDYEICKKGNANFVRLCHYPHHLKEYEIASEMGFLAIAEVPNVNLRKEHFTDQGVKENCLNQLKELLKYYKNETCIAFWSLFIECDTYEDEAVDFVPYVINTVKANDPTRMTIHASNIPLEDRTYDYFDIVGINYWSGWYNGESLEQGSQMLDQIAGRYPGKPVIITSGGWEAIYGAHSAARREKWSEEVQAEYLQNASRMYMSKSYIVGEIFWTFNDFRVTPWLKGNEKGQNFASWVLRPMELNNKGVLDLYRRPKLAYSTLADAFKEWDAR
jgi:beta-glucuronidase